MIWYGEMNSSSVWKGMCPFGNSQMEETIMKFTKNIGMLLLAAWLILFGLLVIAPGITFQGEDKIRAVLAIVAGVFIVLGR